MLFLQLLCVDGWTRACMALSPHVYLHSLCLQTRAIPLAIVTNVSSGPTGEGCCMRNAGTSSLDGRNRPPLVTWRFPPTPGHLDVALTSFAMA